MMKLVSLLAIAVLVTGCASIGGGDQQDPFTDLRAFVRTDVSSALARATKATDAGAPYRARCYTTMLKYLAPEASPLIAIPTPAGVVDAFEIAAEKIGEAQTGGIIKVPEELQANCGYLKDEIRRFALRVGAKSLVPGAGLLLR